MVPDSSLDGDDHRAGSNQTNAGPSRSGRAFSKEGKGKEGDKYDAQLVDRRDHRSWSELERTEIAKPGGSCSEARENKESPGSR